MVKQKLWQQLKSLSSLDKEINLISQKMSSCQNYIKNNVPQTTLLKNKVESEKALLLLIKKEVKLKELAIEEIEEKIRSKEKSLEQISSQREEKALTQELKTLKELRAKAEEKLFESWQQLELAQINLKNLETLSDKEITKIKELTEEKEKLLIDYKKLLTIKTEEREKETAQIHPDWLAKYENMRTNVDNPVVPLQNATCSACFYAILKQDMVRLEKHALLPCKNCYRLLYYDSDQIPEPAY